MEKRPRKVLYVIQKYTYERAGGKPFSEKKVEILKLITKKEK